MNSIVTLEDNFNTGHEKFKLDSYFVAILEEP